MLMLLQSKIMMIIIGLSGVSLVGHKVINDLRVRHHRLQADKTEREVLKCYGIKISNKLNKCLLKAKDNHKRINNCQKKYGDK